MRVRHTRSVVAIAKRTYNGVVYRSGAEASVARNLTERGRVFEYEAETVVYTTSHFTRVDWRIPTASGGRILVESKGWFPPGDRAKVAAVVESNPDLDYRLLILATSAKHRAECVAWAKKHRIKYAVGVIPDAWYEE